MPRNGSQTALGAAPDRHRLRLALAIVALLACGLLWWRFYVLPGRDQYVLVVDAGSSGTRMLAYRWQPASADRPGMPRLSAIPPSAATALVPRRALGNNRAYSRVETEPGLDQFVSDRQGLEGRALLPLIKWAQAALPRSAWRRTPLFLFGTAGLRRLPDADQGKLLAAVREVLIASPFRFEAPWARVIEGADEGVFGWVALNYLQGTLAPAVLRNKQQQLAQQAAEQTVGALDLGGSSLEVTFAADKAALAADQANISVLGTTHQLYCHVHQHFGLNDAFERSVSLLLQRQSPALVIAGGVQEGPDKSKAGQTGAAAGEKAQHTPDQEAAQQGIQRQQQLEQQAKSQTDGAAGLAGAGLEQAGGIGSHSGGSSSTQQLPEYAHRRSLLLAVPEVLQRGLVGATLNDKSSQTMQQQQAAQMRWLQRQLLAEESAARQGFLASAHHTTAAAELPLHQKRRLLADAKAITDTLPESRGHNTRNAAGAKQGRQLPRPLLEVPHPCLHEGYSQQYHRLVLDGVPPSPREVLLVGRPDFSACARLASEVVNASTAGCPHCALGVPQPATSGHKFLALAGFYVVYHFYGLPTLSTLSQVRAAGQRFCETPWAQVAAQRADEIHVDRYCFRAPYIAALLTEGLGLQEAQVQIGSPDVSWTLGAALVEGYQLAGLGHSEGAASSLRISTAMLTDLGGGGWALLGAGALLLAYAAWRRRRSRHAGSPNRLGKRRSAEPAALNGQLLPTTSPPRGLPVLGSAPFSGSPALGITVSGGASKGLSPPLPGSGGWAVSPRSPLQALGARLFGGAAPQHFTKRRSMSWAALDDPNGPAAAAAAANGGGGPGRGGEAAHGSGSARAARGQGFARRSYGGVSTGD